MSSRECKNSSIAFVMYVDSTSAVNTPYTKLRKEQSIGQLIDYILGWTLVIRISLGHHT